MEYKIKVIKTVVEELTIYEDFESDAYLKALKYEYDEKKELSSVVEEVLEVREAKYAV